LIKSFKKQLTPPSKALLFTAIMVNDKELIPKIDKILSDTFSKIELVSDIYDFNHSDYYNPEMGDLIFKYFISFDLLINKEDLPNVKKETISIEDEFLIERKGSICRNINIDPGYLTHSKVIVSTSKNYSHRIHLKDGVFAELTYIISKEGWKPLEWTYPDYRSNLVIDYFTRLRTDFIKKIKGKS
jgi:hypothetical protein